MPPLFNVKFICHYVGNIRNHIKFNFPVLLFIKNFLYCLINICNSLNLFSEIFLTASIEILNFNDKEYSDKRFFYQARDGVNIPAIIFYKNDTDLATAPILFYGYGSYGINTEASFRQSLLPLLNRGFVYVILNIRGIH